MVREIQSKQEFDALLANEAGDKLVVVDFTATWCGPCKALEPVLDELSEAYDGRAIIAKVDVDESPDLASKYKGIGVPRLFIHATG